MNVVNWEFPSIGLFIDRLLVDKLAIPTPGLESTDLLVFYWKKLQLATTKLLY